MIEKRPDFSLNRDMNLIRTILLKLEEGHGTYLEFRHKSTDYSNEMIEYHSWLLQDAGLAYADNIQVPQTTSGFRYLPPRASLRALTWAGHDFLDSARDQTRWDKAKEIAGKEATGIPFEILKKVLSALFIKSIEAHFPTLGGI